MNWLGAAPLMEVAQQIAHAHGPSGPNSEYLYRLADTMRKVRAGSWSPMHMHLAETHGQRLRVAQVCDWGLI